MPELPEVETVRRHMETALKGKKIKEVQAEEDKYLFAFTSANEVRKALEGAKVTGSGRRGKYFWLELNRKPWPIIHLGMSGNVAILKAKETGAHQKAWGGRKRGGKNPEVDQRLWFCRLLLVASDKTEVGVTDPRRFGRMWLADDPLKHPRIAKLGNDPLVDFPSAKELQKKLSRRKAPIKAVLLDQGLFAGIGNWLADEILYQSRLAPDRLANELTLAQIQTIRTKTLAILKKAVAVGADYERFPSSWLFSHRWGKKANSKVAAGHAIEHTTIGGRTTAWVPDIQK